MIVVRMRALARRRAPRRRTRRRSRRSRLIAATARRGPTGTNTATISSSAGRGEQRERRREREPVDVRLVRSLAEPLRRSMRSARLPPKRVPGDRGSARPRARAGRRRAARRTASSPRRRSSAASVTAGPGSWCSTPEISRSMYIAASTIATAPTTAQPQPCWKTPARIRNSPANERRERHRERDHAGRHHERRERGPPARHAAEPRELAGRRAPLDHPGEQEQRRRDQPVVDHLQHGAVEAEVVEGEEAEHDQPHLRERRVGDDAAEVGRAEREQRPVDEPDRRQREQHVAPVVRGRRELRDRDAQEAVEARLGDDAREHAPPPRAATRGRRRQPAVEREERRLDREGDRRSRGRATSTSSCPSSSGRTCPAGGRAR